MAIRSADPARTTPKRHSLSSVPYLPGLDGLRALAVIAVILYHADVSWMPGGFLGVEVFFVVSGYLITLLLIGEQERNGRISLKAFWGRRARRLLPALYGLLVGGGARLVRPAVPQGHARQAPRRPVLVGVLRQQLVPDRPTSSRTSKPRAARRCSATCGRWRSRSSSTSSGRW